MARHLAHLALLLAGGLLFVGVRAECVSAQEQGYILAHKTLYFAPGLGGAHRFEINGGIMNGAGKGTLVIDKNTCELNEYGDRTKCTEVAYPPIKVVFKLLRLSDPAMQQREVYSVSSESSQLPDEYSFTLVIGRKTKPEVLRLVVMTNKKRSAFPLVPQSEYDKAP